ncbi:MAG: response regulator [Gemmatimonadales bacterium]|nr:MAG: response regulator [Gemmatimonadales bacterium]
MDPTLCELRSRLTRAEDLLAAVGTCTRRLAWTSRWERCASHIMETLGKGADASRAYLFRNGQDADGTVVSTPACEWTAEGVRPRRRSRRMDRIPVVGVGFARWATLMEAGEVVEGPVHRFPESERRILNRRNVRSLLAVPVGVDGCWWGFLGLEDCRTERIWSDAERHALLGVSAALGAAISRQLAGNTLRERERRYRGLIESSPYAVWILDGEGRFAEVNPAVEALVRRSSDEIVGLHFEDLLAPEDQGRARDVLGRVMSGHAGSLEGEFRIVRPPRERRLVLVAATAMREGSTIVGVHGISRDITDERRRDEHVRRTQRLASLGTLTSGVAHELNNPLTAIVGMTQLLRDDPALAHHRPMLETVVREARRTSRIVTDLRQLARKSQDEDADHGEVDLNEVATHALRVRRYALETQSTRVDSRFAPDLPRIRGDQGRLVQVILNLLVNAEQAVQEMPMGRRIEVRTRRNGSHAMLEVHDNGPGIPAEHQERIFDPFWTTKGAEAGVGLGLSLCHSIVADHAGSIQLDSGAGRGTRFVVRLPLMDRRDPGKGRNGMKRPEAPSAEGAPSVEGAPRESASGEPSQESSRETPAAGPEGEGDSGRTRILAVDDEPGIRQLLRTHLERQGHLVVVAADGAEALRRIREADGPFDLVLSDLRMPGMDGEELLRRIAEDHPDAVRHLAAMTGDVTSPTVDRIVKEWGVEVIRKPFDLQELDALIHRILGSD